MRPLLSSLLASFLLLSASAADIPGSKDPAGLKRYEGSNLIGFQAPKQDEYFLSKGKTREFGKVNPFGEESQKLEGLLSRYTYLVPDAGRTAFEVFANYKTEFGKLGLEIAYAPDPDDDGWFGPTYSQWEDQAKLGQILEYNEAEERYLIAKTKDANPTYYVLFVTSYKDGIIPPSLEGKVEKKMPLVQLDIIAPATVEERMTLVKAEEMQRKIDADGGIALYGILFDFNKDSLKPESTPTLEQIAELLKSQPGLKLYVVGHTDRVGALDFNQDFSQRRAKSVVKELVTTYKISSDRLASAGVAFLAPVARNSTDEGRAKNRRVVLIPQEK
ncbi:OmpA family protein [Luteolibacter sp. Populi]|uniref:OmpA family protein n=1 Tax=Luteolibacter sp. Populi TaxID=3230487 RepID=UPI003467C8C7